jgi:hypothetical protein
MPVNRWLFLHAIMYVVMTTYDYRAHDLTLDSRRVTNVSADSDLETTNKF